MHNNVNNNNIKNIRWISTEEDSESSEDSWDDEYLPEIDLNYLYVNDMNAKNNKTKSKEGILAELQSVINMCTAPESVSDVIKNPLNNDDVINWVEKECMLLDEELKNTNAKNQEENIEKRRGMLKGIRSLVQRKSQLDMEAGTLETVNSKNEIMIMSFVRPETLSTNQNRLRAGARESLSHSVYSKYSQTNDLNKPKKVSSNTQETQTKLRDSVIDIKRASTYRKNKPSPDTSLSTDTKCFNSTSSSTMQSKDTFSSFLYSSSTGTKSTDTRNNAKNTKDLCYLCSTCAENDALPLNTKVSTMSTNNLKVIHISLGGNKKPKHNVNEPVCFKCLKNKGTIKKKTPKLCLNTFTEITGNGTGDSVVLKNQKIPTYTDPLFKENPTKDKELQNYLKIIKSANSKRAKSNDKDKLAESSSMASFHSLKTSSVAETHFTNDTSMSYSKAGSIRKSDKTYVRGLEKPLRKGMCKFSQTISNESTDKDDFSDSRSDGALTELTGTNESTFNSKTQKKSLVKSPTQHYSSPSSSGTTESIFLIECEPEVNAKEDCLSPLESSQNLENKLTKNVAPLHQKKNSKQHVEMRKDINCLFALKDGGIPTQEDINKQKAALESIKELNENASNEHSGSTKTAVKVPSNRTIIISNRTSLKTYNVQTSQFLALNKGAFGDNGLPIKKKSKHNSMRSALRSIENVLSDANNIVTDEENLKSLELALEDSTGKKDSLKSARRKGTFMSLDNSFMVGPIKQKKAFTDDSSWHDTIPQITKQINEQLHQSQSGDSIKTHFVNLNVENPDGIDIDSEKVSVVQECQLKCAKRFNMAQLFGHSPQPCECEECTRNRPVEIRYATTKISKFQRYSTFEILKSSKYKPKFLSSNTESIFVMKNKNLT